MSREEVKLPRYGTATLLQRMRPGDELGPGGSYSGGRYALRCRCDAKGKRFTHPIAVTKVKTGDWAWCAHCLAEHVLTVPPEVPPS